MTVLYWESDCEIPDNEEFDDSFLTDWSFANVSLKHSIELIGDFGVWEVDRRSRHRHDRVQVGDGWHTEPFAVSIIDIDLRDWETFKVAYQPSIGSSLSQQQQDVENKWNEIENHVNSYPYAEHSRNSQPQIDSKYFLPSPVGSPPYNNSNSFVRWVMNESSIPMPNLAGVFPGANLPADVPDADYRNIKRR